MTRHLLPISLLTVALAACMPPSRLVAAQDSSDTPGAPGDEVTMTVESPGALAVPPAPRFRTRADSIAHETTREKAFLDTGLHVEVDLAARRLYVVEDGDTLRDAAVAIGVDTVLSWRGQTWRFETPRGVRRVRGKTPDPVWIPPDWHYVEVAARYDLKLERLHPRRPRKLADGRQLMVRNRQVGVLDAIGFLPLPTDEEIVFDSTLFIPPLGTKNREIPGELGRYRLDMGNGYLLHGTPHEDSIGRPVTHGCVRLADEDIEWLYENLPLGTRVYIY